MKKKPYKVHDNVKTLKKTQINCDLNILTFFQQRTRHTDIETAFKKIYTITQSKDSFKALLQLDDSCSLLSPAAPWLTCSTSALPAS